MLIQFWFYECPNVDRHIYIFPEISDDILNFCELLLIFVSKDSRGSTEYLENF